jgi:cytidyltransferase-like protein
MTKDRSTTSKEIVALSGGFDPPNPGHVALIQDARSLGDVVIILNSDTWCDQARWSGRYFLSYDCRRKILENIPGVISVIPAEDTDGTVCETLRVLKPDFFGNGGKRTSENTPEVEVCRELRIGMLWFLGQSENAEHEEMLRTAIIEATRPEL